MSDLDAILDAAVEEVAAPAPAAAPAAAAEPVDDDELNSPTVASPAAEAAPSAQQMSQLFRGIPSMDEMQQQQQQKAKKEAAGAFFGVRLCEKVTRISVYVGLAAFIWTAGGIRSSP
eukprot:TRINITY_DN29806_c0_g1_i1.p1 TRINITY_DN29806_c0_g1~~TRINITY_DN29806_c0_g1_i1.p1  ORF type:complete len:117 (+),score=53.42 TRINITY_DN29806_c0_g1_i1:42-392(+)